MEKYYIPTPIYYVNDTLHDLAVKRKKLIESGVPEEDQEIREIDALIEVI